MGWYDDGDDDDAYEAAKYGDYDGISGSGVFGPEFGSGRHVVDTAYSSQILQYVVAAGLIAAAIVLFKALNDWTPGPPDNRTFWEKMEGKPR